MRNPLPLKAWTLAALFFPLSGCAHYHVVPGGDAIAAPLPAVTGVDTARARTAAAKPSLGLFNLYALAVERTETLASQTETLEQAEAQRQQALGAWLPQVRLTGQKTWTSGTYAASGPVTGGFSGDGDSLVLSGAETLLSGLDQVAALQGAQAQIDAGRFGLRNGAGRLLLDLADAYYSVLELTDTLKTDQDSRDLTQKILDVQKHWVAIGRAQKSDMLSTSAQLAQLDATLQSDRTQLTQEREELAFLAGVPPDVSLEAPDAGASLPAYSLEQALAKVDARPDVAQAKAQWDVAEAQVLAAHGQHLPTLVASGNYALAADGANSPREWTVGLQASIPVFEGGQLVAQERQADSKRNQAKLAWSQTRRQALEDIRKAYQGLQDSLQQTQAFQASQQASQEAYEAVLHDYNLNLQTPLALLQALNTLEAAKADYAKTRYQTLYDQVWLGVALGDLPQVTGERP